jgi:hypothetical protein
LLWEYTEQDPSWDALQDYALELVFGTIGVRRRSILRTRSGGSFLPWKNMYVSITSGDVSAQITTLILRGGERCKARGIESKLIFTFLPVQQSENKHLDCPTILFALAISRGSLTPSLQYIQVRVPPVACGLDRYPNQERLSRDTRLRHI